LSKNEQTAISDGLTKLLRNAQLINGSNSFGVCATCQFFQKTESGEFKCGVTEELLSVKDSTKICVEHKDAS
ncbi:MAG: MarR family transcriptional regulator, partial [Pseudomonadota bacterium]